MDSVLVAQLAGKERVSVVPVAVLEGHGFCNLLTVMQLYAHVFVKVLDDVRSLEDGPARLAFTELNLPGNPGMDAARETMRRLIKYCGALRLSSAAKQLAYMDSMNLAERTKQWHPLIQDLRRWINEDLRERAFFCVTDPKIIEDHFKLIPNEEYGVDVLSPKVASELFGDDIVRRFKVCVEDIEQASRCYVLDRHPACMFHLMRIVEIGVKRVGKLGGLIDPRASWETVLRHIDKLVHKTKPADVPLDIQPHIPLLADLLPEMHSIQRAWRNTIIHIEDKMIPTAATVDPEVTRDTIVAVRVFMQRLAKELPPGM